MSFKYPFCPLSTSQNTCVLTRYTTPKKNLSFGCTCCVTKSRQRDVSVQLPSDTPEWKSALHKLNCVVAIGHRYPTQRMEA